MNALSKFIVVLALCALPAGALYAQSRPVVIGGAVSSNILPAGTEIAMRTTTEISSKTARVGERFALEVVDDVRLNGQTVIRAGTAGVGEVTSVTKKGMFGKSGKIATRLVSVRVGDQNVRIRGAVGDRGKSGTAGTVGAMVFVPVAGFFVTGTSAVIPPNTTAVGYLESDLPVVFAQGSRPATPVVITQGN